MYTDYVGNFDKATETLSLWTKKLPTMAALIDEIQVSYRTQDTYSLPMVGECSRRSVSTKQLDF